MPDLEKLIRDVRKEWSSSEEGTIGGDVLALCEAADALSAELERWKVKYNTLWDVDLTHARVESQRNARRAEAAEALIALYRQAQIVSREFDEGDDEMEEAWHAAYLAHVAYDPTLSRDQS
jgi:hypothetical protein